MGVIHPRLAFAGVEIFTNFWFLAHNFCSRYAGKPLKCSKDADHSLVSKKKLVIELGPRPGKVGRKVEKTCPHCDPQKTPNPKRKIFSFNLN